MKVLAQPQHNSEFATMFGSVLALLSAAVSLIPFFLMPFALTSFSAHFKESLDGPVSDTNISLLLRKSWSYTISAPATTADLAQVNGLIWIIPVFVIVMIVLTALLVFRNNNPFGLTNVTPEKQVRGSALALLSLALLNIIIVFIVLLSATQSVQTAINNNSRSTSEITKAAVTLDAGGWFFFLAMVIIIVSAIFLFTKRVPVFITKSVNALVTAQAQANASVSKPHSNSVMPQQPTTGAVYPQPIQYTQPQYPIQSQQLPTQSQQASQGYPQQTQYSQPPVQHYQQQPAPGYIPFQAPVAPSSPPTQYPPASAPPTGQSPDDTLIQRKRIEEHPTNP